MWLKIALAIAEKIIQANFLMVGDMVRKRMFGQRESAPLVGMEIGHSQNEILNQYPPPKTDFSPLHFLPFFECL